MLVETLINRARKENVGLLVFSRMSNRHIPCHRLPYGLTLVVQVFTRSPELCSFTAI